MLTRTLLAATAALALTGAAQAQDATPQAAPETPAAAPMDEAAFAARHGLFVVPRVVFTTGCVRLNDAQWLFSGVNDFAIERARLGPLEAVLANGYV